MGRKPIPDVFGPVFDVTDSRFGASPDDGQDDTAAIQAAVDAAGEAGGGVVLLPKGRYDIRKTTGAPYLRITYDNVILRGQGNGSAGTVLYLGSAGPLQTVRRLGSVPPAKEPRSAAAIAVMGTTDRKPLCAYTESLVRGAREVTVSDASTLSAGQMVVIKFTDPLIDGQTPDSKKADIPVQLTRPFRFTGQETHTFGKLARTLTWMVRIERVINDRTIRLAKPARFDQMIGYRPHLFTFHGVVGVGIENLRIESRWPGGYRHHKPYLDGDNNVIRTALEQDYLWVGLWISHAADGWVRNVTFKDLTQGIVVSHSADLTVEKVRFEGKDGHAGVTIGRSNDILVSQADFFARLVHPMTVTMMAAGNVFTNCRIHYDGRDDWTQTDAAIDFHGLFPFENLFDNLDGFYICAGGDASVLPHAGVRNVFWNIEAPCSMSCHTREADDEFARSEAYVGTSSKTPLTMYEHFPKSFYIGIRKKGGRLVSVGGTDHDRNDDWMTVEGLNREKIAIPSLYEAQHAGCPR